MDHHSQRAPRPLFSQQPDYSRPHVRPLSDIRELTEPSLLEAPLRITRAQEPQKQEIHPKFSNKHAANERGRTKPPGPRSPPTHGSATKPARKSEDRTSIYSIPRGDIPPRSSSKDAAKRSFDTGRKRSTSIAREPAILLRPPKPQFRSVTNTGQAQSPLRNINSRQTSLDQHRALRIPSKTIVKVDNLSSEYLLQQPYLPHPRLKIDLLLAAPLFVGGSSVEGVLRIVVDEGQRLRHKKLLTLERVSIDLLGVEEITHPNPKSNIFLTLGNELVDTSHPPPAQMVDPQEPFAPTPTTRSWILVPSVSTLPFLIQLPLKVGPPPFESKFASIRYLVCATLIINDAGRQLSVRCSADTSLLSVQDPERALVSLPSPLTATEQAVIRQSKQERISITAGLHRQVWVSGTNLFTDVHIVNESHKTVRKLELRLERIVLCYNHAAAATLEHSASGARMFDQKERVTIVKTSIRPGSQGWNGVLPYTSVLRTCGVEIPRGHASISCHTLFEVRYYLYIAVFTTRSKVATVQLPIHLIHMNSLDVPTNSVAQVAAAIEERRIGRGPHPTTRNRGLRSKSSNASLQGRAFAAPRMESLDRARARQRDPDGQHSINQGYHTPLSHSRERAIETLRKISSTFSFKTPKSKRKGRVFGSADADEISRQLHHMRKNSVGSSGTCRSVPRGRYPPGQSSALDYYLHEAGYLRDASNDRARSGYARSVVSSGRPSFDRYRNSTSRPRTSRDLQISTKPSVDSIRPSSGSRGRQPLYTSKGKERALDW